MLLVQILLSFLVDPSWWSFLVPLIPSHNKSPTSPFMFYTYDTPRWVVSVVWCGSSRLCIAPRLRSGLRWLRGSGDDPVGCG